MSFLFSLYGNLIIVHLELLELLSSLKEMKIEAVVGDTSDNIFPADRFFMVHQAEGYFSCTSLRFPAKALS